MNILVIDDEKSFLEPLIDFDKRNPHYKIYTSSKGTHGIELFKKYNIDLVIIDYKMSEIDGVELLQQLKSIKSDVLVYCLSGYEISTHKEDIFLFDKVFMKPISPIEIIEDFIRESEKEFE